MISKAVAELGQRIRSQQNVFPRSWKAFQAIDKAVKKFGYNHPRKTTAADDRPRILQVKRVRYQSAAPLLSNCVQHLGDKCRGLSTSQRKPIRPPS
ncbi:hypothetical protein TNCV_2443471 [Trichonephila clavipes]|nr:hypothetical protein TNCV_2443471 [Trichonephila clavipes]